ncbi:S1 family peptidase [Streptomyces gamaensis]|uniref:S1 family peptidase n=1 Tax=Streptomyces gamaensis TaxID=1763542 RepID=A0ABW0YU65_9ACTN
MIDSHSRAKWATALVATAVSGGLLTAAPAHAISGDPVKDGEYAFTAKVDIEGKAGCSGALVDTQWVLTAASCFADEADKGAKLSIGAPKSKTTVTVGRTDLSGQGGTVVDAVMLFPHEQRDVVMLKLAAPVKGPKPLGLRFGSPEGLKGLRATGYGRTKDDAAAGRVRTATFAAGAVKGDSFELVGEKPDGAAVCEGDLGGPVFEPVGGPKGFTGYDLVGINGPAPQGGCSNGGGTAIRLDDIADWIQGVHAYSNVPAGADWKEAKYIASGNFVNKPGHDRMDLFVVWKNGAASLYEGSWHDKVGSPFWKEHKIADAGSYWTRAGAVTAGNFTGEGSDGLVVRWTTGKVSEYRHLDENGVHDERTLREGGGDNPFWQRARLITAGKFTENSLRDDLLVLWDNGSTSMYTDIDSKGLSGWQQMTNADDGWKNAVAIGAGSFSGKATDDLLIVWDDGQVQTFPGVTPNPNGYPGGRTTIKETGSGWKNAQALTVGNFTAGKNRVNDILVSWNNGNLGYFPGVDAKGTHGGCEILKGNGAPPAC